MEKISVFVCDVGEREKSREKTLRIEMRTLKNAGDKTRLEIPYDFFFQSKLFTVFFLVVMKVHFVLFWRCVLEEKKRMKEQTRLYVV